MFRTPKYRAPTKPGEVLLEEFLHPLRISQVELARMLGIPFQRVNQIVRGRRSLTPDSALRLSRLFGTSVDFWLNLQLACDVYDAEHSERAQEIRRIKALDTSKLAAAS